MSPLLRQSPTPLTSKFQIIFSVFYVCGLWYAVYVGLAADTQITLPANLPALIVPLPAQTSSLGCFS